VTTLEQLAGWDLPQLRGGVGTLGVVCERLLPWRLRLDELGRRLATAECWSGPAGQVAAAALVELSTVATGVVDALGRSLEDLHALTGAATTAQDDAAQALALARDVGLVLDPAGRPVGLPPAPHPAMAPDQGADLLAARAAAERAAVQVGTLADQAPPGGSA
jgi:hypothetical protein